MTATGIDTRIAREHGYEVVTLPDGSRASIKRDKLRALGSKPSANTLRATASSVVPSRSDGVRPENTITGDCGESYYYISIYAGGTWSSITGYTVRDTVASKQWHTYLQDPTGGQIAGTEYDEGPTGVSWEGTDEDPPALVTAGRYLGGVDSGVVYLVDGTSCFSGGPADTADY